MTESSPGHLSKSEPPTGYRLILPPGWVRIPLRTGTTEVLEELVFSRLKQLPPGVPKDKGMKYRLMVRHAVMDQITEARKANGLDLYLPVTMRYGNRLAASFLVSEVVADGEGEVPPEAMLARLAAVDDPSVESSTGEMAGVPAVRREYLREPSAERGVHVPTRHVEFALPIPHERRRFLAVSFSTAGDGDPGSDFTTAVVELFDAVMATFRWIGDTEESTSDTLFSAKGHSHDD